MANCQLIVGRRVKLVLPLGERLTSYSLTRPDKKPSGLIRDERLASSIFRLPSHVLLP
jgi:hypothetical protein